MTFPIIMVVSAFSAFAGQGGAPLASIELGAKNYKKAEKILGNSTALLIVFAIVLTIFFQIFKTPLLYAFGASDNVIKYAHDYIGLYLYGTIFVMLSLGLNTFISGQGNAKVAMLSVLIGAVTNIVLDPILIYGYFGLPAMGVRGAAIATVIGQITALIASIYVLFFRKQEITIEKKDFSWNLEIVKEIYNVGIPSFFIMSIGSFLVMGINFILSGISTLAVSLFGIYFKLQTFIYMPTSGVTQGAMPIMGYSYGAKNRRRLSEVLNYSIIICVLINFLGSVLFWLFPQEILHFFNATDEMMSIGVRTIRIISTSYSFGSICFIFSCFLQAIGKGIPSLTITMLRQLILLLPMAYILGRIYGLTGVWLAFPTVEVITCMISIYMYRNFVRKDPVMAMNR